MKTKLISLASLAAAIGVVFATTWMDKDIKCPVCGKNKTFQAIASYGSYIYNWPEKLQFVFWPTTTSPCLYSCPKCKYTAFMWDFNKVGSDTLALIKRELPNLKLTLSGYDSPMIEKLEAAEKIYRLYRVDFDFWCRFYRIMGYHYELMSENEKARAARLKALSLADSMLALPGYEVKKKELIYITAAMKHYTGQDSLSLLDIDLGQPIVVNDPQADSETNAGANQYLNELFNELKDSVTTK
jgi:hypothetical protein